MMNYLKVINKDILILKVDNIGNSYWYLDTVFAIHQDTKCYVDTAFSFKKAGVDNSSIK